MKVSIVVFSTYKGAKTLKVMTGGGKIPNGHPPENMKLYVTNFLLEFGIKYHWAYESKGFTDDTPQPEFFYAFSVPEDIPLINGYEWQRVDELNLEDQRLLEVVRRTL